MNSNSLKGFNELIQSKEAFKVAIEFRPNFHLPFDREIYDKSVSLIEEMTTYNLVNYQRIAQSSDLAFTNTSKIIETTQTANSMNYL